jgi:hypothetical protein
MASVSAPAAAAVLFCPGVLPHDAAHSAKNMSIAVIFACFILIFDFWFLILILILILILVFGF